ncbi:hypothetical protein KRR39_23475 [Nocardioides panacis]|uniref:ABM domain-containing protein n=1 Tax=Nocardioides panacis TaxID=2849501 RepID=A0A975Y095_9ACTN|nr:hypothetical protein [Nocardioides panacis]QWZ08242.1 hypothetical protein KRR39_23475 [Nocardioides panacis]
MGERWLRELAPGADGWLGGTYGFTDDDQFLAIVRFESQEAAAANAARPEQGAWWSEMERLFDGPVEFHDCADVTLLMDGGSDDAGFVQVIRGKVDDVDTLKAMMTDTEQLHEMRPEILGGTLAIEADGSFIETVSFSDEESARRGEQVAMPEEVRRAMETAMHDVRYLDLHQPWFASR